MDKKGSYVTQSDPLSLYPIYQVPLSGCNKSITVFCDGGSNTTYITHRAAQQIKARKLGKLKVSPKSQRWEMWSAHTTPNNTNLRSQLTLVSG